MNTYILDNKPVITLNGASDYIKNLNIDFVTALVHEATHLCIDRAFANDSKPFAANDITEREVWENLASQIISDLQSEMPCEHFKEFPEELMSYVSKGYNEFGLMSYQIRFVPAEIPAFFMQKVATRLLVSNTTDMREVILFQYQDLIMKVMNTAAPMVESTDQDYDVFEHQVSVASTNEPVLPDSVISEEVDLAGVDLTI